MRELLKRNALAVRLVHAARARLSPFKAHAGLVKRVAELEARLSVAEGRSSLNAERNVRTHASLQNLAEDFNAVTNQVERLRRTTPQAQAAESEAE